MRPRKFEEMAKDLEAQILSGTLKPGDLIPSQSRLCEQYSVSRSCAQKALEELDTKGFLESHPGKGVYVKGAQRKEEPRPRFKNVAVVFHQEFRLESDPADNFGLEMLWGVEEELRKFDANCIIRKREREAGFDKIVPELESIGADAFIMDREFSDEQLSPMRTLGVPVALLGRFSTLPFASSSLPNHGDCFLKAFVRMADEGRENVALIHPGHHYYDPELVWALERAATLRPKTKFTRTEMRCCFGSSDGGIGVAVDEALTKKPEVLVFSNDWQAVRALELLAERRIKVPEELSVLGCYGIALGAKSNPPLSSLTIDAREIGRRAVRALADSALKGAQPKVERVPFTFLERDSFRWNNPQDVD